MPAPAALDTYLNDHLAAGASAVALIDTIRSNNEGTALATYMSQLEPAVEGDRETLARVMDAVGVARSIPKQAGGKVVERLSRLRLHERVTGSADVSRLMEIETLSLGIEGKLALWRALATVSGARPQLAGFDFSELADRAVAQRAGLEPYRLEAAAQALGPG